MRPQVGNVIHNKYRLLRLIGDGGMGAVFEARHEVLGTTVALKFLHVELSRRPGLVQRFLQEARVSAQIQSPNVVRVTDVDQTPNGLAFIVMELLDGKTLQALYEDLYRAGQRLSYADALEYAIQMLEGASAAHKTGIVHRDLKPDNVMITHNARGEVVIKLLDFGIAKLKVSGQFDRGLTRPGVIMGTPEYMAPEQAYSADAVDSRADVFSLAVIIFEMLAGRRPVGGDEPQQIASAYLSGQVADLCDLFPECPVELADAVHKAMAPLAKDRYPSVDAFRAAIEPFWLSIRPPSSLHTSHPSLSFARLTPIPSMRPEIVEPAPHAGASVDPRAEQAAVSAPIPKARPSNGSVATSASMPVVPSTPIPPPRVAKTLPPEEPEDAAPSAVAGPRPIVEAPPPPPQPAPPPLAEAAGSIEKQSASIDGAMTTEGEPPIDSQVPSREPTPLGGFYPFNTEPVPSTAPEGAGRAAHQGSSLGLAPTTPMPQMEIATPAGANAPFVLPVAVAVPAKFEPPPPPPPRDHPAKAGTVKMPIAAPAGAPPAAPFAPIAAAPIAAPPAEASRPRAIAGTRAASLLGSAAPDAPAGISQGASAVNGSGTAEAAPLFAAGLGGTAEAAPLFIKGPPEPNNNAGASKPGTSKPEVAPVVGDRTDVGGAPPVGSGTAQASALPAGDVAVQPAPNAAAQNPPAPARVANKAKRAVPLALVLILAAGVSAAVVGGVYVARRSASVEDHNDDPIVMPTPTAVHADPQPGAADPAPTSPVPAGAPGKNVIRTQPQHPGPPHVPGSGHPSNGPHPPGSAKPSPDQPPSMPPSLPIMIPSGFPFPFPGPPPGPAPQSDPSGRPRRGGGLPPLEPIPRPPQGAEAILPTEPTDR